MYILCLTEKFWIINFIHDNNYFNKKSELMNKCRHFSKFFLKNVIEFEFDSSSTLSECIVFSKIYLGYILSYIGIRDLASSTTAYQLIGLYMSYRDHSWINFRLYYNFLCFVLGINSFTLCLMITEAWNLKHERKMKKL